MVTWEEKCHNSNAPLLLPPSFPQLLLLVIMSDGMGYPFGYSVSAVPGCVPCHCSTGAVLHKEGPDVVQAPLNNNGNFGILGTEVYITNPKHSTVRATVNKINSNPAKTSIENNTTWKLKESSFKINGTF